MSDLVKKLKQVFFEKAKPLSPGLYGYTAPADSPFPYRLHLRIDSSAQGILIINASTVLHLNQTATEFAYHIIKQTPQHEILQSIIDRYQISYSEALRDYESFLDRIETLINTPDLDPVTYLDLERERPFEHELSAPYRLDCALTYQQSLTTNQDFAPHKHVERELTTEEWKTIISKAWDAGIPHIVFTGGEPTLRSDLVELAQHSENLGQVTGLISDGLKLADREYLIPLLQAGLDHLHLILDANSHQAWEALKLALEQDVHVTVHLTLREDNYETIEDLLVSLQKTGLENISLSSSTLELMDKTKQLRDRSAELGFNLIWNLPVPYSVQNPINAEITRSSEFSEGAGTGWLYVEPDGDVLLAQGMFDPLGNLVENDWKDIWSNTRQRVKAAA